MRCRSELLYLPVAGEEKDLRFKLNVSVFHAGVEAGNSGWHLPCTGRRSGGSAVFQRAGDP